MVGKYFAPIEPTPQILTAARNQNRYRKKTKSFGPESPKLSPSEKKPERLPGVLLVALGRFFLRRGFQRRFLGLFL